MLFYYVIYIAVVAPEVMYLFAVQYIYIWNEHGSRVVINFVDDRLVDYFEAVIYCALGFVVLLLVK